jgi:NAD(P)-dependent dehydrogenase (short-subunit alcohol dehydrogenase family)
MTDPNPPTIAACEEKIAIVTGGSSGIGRGIAIRLAKDGMTVINADRQRSPKQGIHFNTTWDEPTDELIEDEFDGDGRYIETDISQEADVERLIEETVETYDRLDVLVNNAGILIPGSSQEVTLEEWQQVIDVNLTSQFLLAKHAIPHLVESSQGRIVNVSSVNAYFGGAGPPYASTKAAIVNLTRDLAQEVAAEGVTVNTVLPGVIKTPMQDLNDEETIERQTERTLLPRLGTPRDVAAAVAFFASEEAEWITGAQLLVDGGYLASGY